MDTNPVFNVTQATTEFECLTHLNDHYFESQMPTAASFQKQIPVYPSRRFYAASFQHHGRGKAKAHGWTLSTEIKPEGPVFPVRSLRNFRNPIHHQLGFGKVKQENKNFAIDLGFSQFQLPTTETPCALAFFDHLLPIWLQMWIGCRVLNICAPHPVSPKWLNSEENDTGGTRLSSCAEYRKQFGRIFHCKNLKNVPLIMTTKDQMQV